MKNPGDQINPISIRREKKGQPNTKELRAMHVLHTRLKCNNHNRHIYIYIYDEEQAPN